MEKKQFQVEYEKIEVPKEDVLNAIQTGVRRANSTDTPKRNKKRLSAYSLSAAAAIFISSSFIFPSMSHVMAEVPLLGKVYMNFNDLVGRNLESQQLITKLNETASNKGIDVSITSAYYDGAVIGVTFNVAGNIKTEQDGGLMGFYEIFDGKEGIDDSKEIVYMEPSEKGYSGHIQLNYPKSELPPDTTFPLEFKSIGEKEGVWKFDIPIKQLPYETIKSNEERRNIGADVKVHFDSIIKGKASTAINYTATFPSEGKHDQVRLEVFNDQGKEIPLLSDGIDLETYKSEHQITVKGRTIIPQSLKEKTSYLEIQPKVAVHEKDQFVTLEQQTPIEINSNRQNLSVTVEKMTLKEDNFIVDFQVNHGDMRNWNFTFFKDFARNDITLVKESEKGIYEEPMKHSIKVLDEKDLRFRSTFDIGTVSDFSKDNYVLRVNLSSLSMNIPLELESVKIDLN
ncbi:DUF4179 domain-containing protein [Peribacillus butanolivorans]|uniref:DUF4179 domain-containing protein n=1 Tax=Peribacillus butanolivorans TaxID=421767 RepID=A0AAX0RYM9_9BACI|nr:DUF4179 domain-containing protein [Peribacillus butanolivorans]PEJ29630.1 DUF4179 domain-containing protein [Peribacillus butanolivorans]